MGFQDNFNYVLFGNPVSQQIISAGCAVINKAGKVLYSSEPNTPSVPVPHRPAVSINLWRISGCNHNLIRIAGLSGASAVLLGAYGSHRNYDDEKGESKSIFETANRFHFFHTIALLALPLSHRPLLSGTLMITGTILFTGPCYRRAFTGDNSFSKMAPVGGVVLIAAWLSLII